MSEIQLNRQFIPLQQPNELDGFHFSIMSWNMLAQGSIRRDHFAWCTSEHVLKWPYRSVLLKSEIAQHNADIICGQEVDLPFWNKFWVPEMKKLGYTSIFKGKPMFTKNGQPNPNTYGVAIWFKTDKFDMVEYEPIEFRELAEGKEGTDLDELDRPNVGQLVALVPKQSDNNNNTVKRGIIVSNVHFFWNLNYEWTRIKQAQHTIQRMKALQRKLEQTSENIQYSLVFCGDFNSSPDTIIYQFVTNRQGFPEKETNRFLPPTTQSNNLNAIVSDSMAGNREERMYARVIETDEEKKRIVEARQVYDIPTSELPLFSSVYRNYTDLTGTTPSTFWKGEPPFTEYAQWKGTLDYIMVEQKEDNPLKPLAILSIPEDEVLQQIAEAAPNQLLPSDHFPIICRFVL